MPQQHEILAVENSASETASRITKEVGRTFSTKHDLFMGITKENIIHQEDLQHLKAATQVVEVQSTVDEQLQFLSKHLSEYYDIILQKEEANQRAKADIIVDGQTIATDVPSIVLLSLEKKLTSLLGTYNAIPTLDSAKTWEVDPNYAKEGVYRLKYPEERQQDVVNKEWRIIAPATDRHPAQTKEVESKQVIGKYVVTAFSGAIPSVAKANKLEKLSKLITAVKKARQRANQVEVNTELSIGNALLGYING